MNIANIMGLHLGCWVKISRTGEKGKIINISTSLSNIGEGIIIIEDLFSGTKAKYIKDCKLILKPLSAITDEDKAEFMEKFNTNSYYNYIDDRTPIDIWRAVKREIKIKEGFWLASKGYDIGIIPDEYKEVEECK